MAASGGRHRQGDPRKPGGCVGGGGSWCGFERLVRPSRAGRATAAWALTRCHVLRRLQTLSVPSRLVRSRPCDPAGHGLVTSRAGTAHSITGAYRTTIGCERRRRGTAPRRHVFLSVLARAEPAEPAEPAGPAGRAVSAIGPSRRRTEAPRRQPGPDWRGHCGLAIGAPIRRWAVLRLLSLPLRPFTNPSPLTARGC